MSPFPPRFTDRQAEQLVGRILQIGVLVSALVVSAGGVLYLTQHGHEPAGHHEFRGEPGLCNLGEIGGEAFHLHARGVIQFGILLLILTPISRVAFTAVVFLAQRDYKFVAITIFVLAILLFSLLAHGCCRDRKRVRRCRQRGQVHVFGRRCTCKTRRLAEKWTSPGRGSAPASRRAIAKFALLA